MKKTKPDSAPSAYTIDSSRIAILSLEGHSSFANSKPATLTGKDLETIEQILQQVLKVYNPNEKKQYEQIKKQNPESKIREDNFVINLNRYKRQYIAFLNEKGEKEVWINCFCGDIDRNWQNEIIFVRNGGNCFFNLKVNLNRGKYYELRVNGEA
ncbi:hypothetical protein GXP67_04070 [Rhodocytophaga rosea]|uniref:Uncharacterized protein n=1 Tax=Rhodocytophaga rosea TaxID=2704465 RepID=A0A6C0GD56_9BACT|nr:hypothetical protein [Rhodocytophaga rosea]QHT65901.1 hypothetical protein GXP67_04070 [Rhodocytophaga rosea]